MNDLLAAIDIGSTAIKFKLVEYSSGHLKCLEDISVPSTAGDMIFKKHYIASEELKEILSVLKYFKQMMKDYGVTKYKAVTTGAFREAKNALNTIAYLQMNSGLHIDMLEDGIEKYITYKGMRAFYENYSEIKKSALLFEMNAGGCDISIVHKNKMVKNDELTLGAKHLKKIALVLERKTIQYPLVLMDYIDAHSDHLRKDIYQKRLLYFVVTGRMAQVYRELIFSSEENVTRAVFSQLLSKAVQLDLALKNKLEKHSIDWYEFLATTVMIESLLRHTQVNTLCFPDVSLRDGLIMTLVEDHFYQKTVQSYHHDIYSVAYEIASRYRSNMAHIKQIEKNALKLFEALHGYLPFSQRDELLLRLSVILHEVGKFTRIKNYEVASLDVIKHLDIYGVTQKEMLLIAHIAAATYRELGDDNLSLKGFDASEVSLIEKLSALLAVADALDKSKHQRVQLTHVYVKQYTCIMTFIADHSIVLEEWAFEQTKAYFECTFGLSLEMREDDVSK